jgi:hypothetical protein
LPPDTFRPQSALRHALIRDVPDHVQFALLASISAIAARTIKATNITNGQVIGGSTKGHRAANIRY